MEMLPGLEIPLDKMVYYLLTWGIIAIQIDQ
jgi:hypothetical protein